MRAELFANGEIVREPVGFENGYWAGAPGVFYEEQEKAFYITYRVRRPRGIFPDRGGESRILRSEDLKTYTDVWAVTKHQYGTASIERSALRKGADGIWRYYTSYVDPADGRWCVAMLKSSEVASLDPGKVARLFSAKPLGLEGIKDPHILEMEGVYYMFLSVALPTELTKAESHATLDIYNTGECSSATGLAVSNDLDHWEWRGIVFAPERGGWDGYCRRINTVLPVGNGYLGLYDGSASHQENYEEKTGLAESTDLMRWRSLTLDKPLLTSPHGTGSLRYCDGMVLEGKVHWFYEMARPDGAHDLRSVQQDWTAVENFVRKAGKGGIS